MVGGDGAEATFDRFDPDPLGVVLVRRGGYACALVSGGSVAESKVGTRHVQSRTAAGGWSQQRFARRRGNQADALVEAVAGHALRILLAGNESPATGAPRHYRPGSSSGETGRWSRRCWRTRDCGRCPASRAVSSTTCPTRGVTSSSAAVERGRAVRVTLTDPAP